MRKWLAENKTIFALLLQTLVLLVGLAYSFGMLREKIAGMEGRLTRIENLLDRYSSLAPRRESWQRGDGATASTELLRQRPEPAPKKK